MPRCTITGPNPTGLRADTILCSTCSHARPTESARGWVHANHDSELSTCDRYRTYGRCERRANHDSKLSTRERYHHHGRRKHRANHDSKLSTCEKYRRYGRRELCANHDSKLSTCDTYRPYGNRRVGPATARAARDNPEKNPESTIFRHCQRRLTYSYYASSNIPTQTSPR